MKNRKFKLVLLVVLVGTISIGSLVLKPWHKENSIKKISLSLGNYEMEFSDEGSIKFNSDIEKLLESTNAKRVTSDIEGSASEDFFYIQIIFNNGEKKEGWMTTNGIVIKDKIYRYTKDQYVEILKNIRYPRILGANAQVIKVVNEEIIYVKWKDEDLNKIFGKNTKINCKGAILYQLIDGNLETINVKNLQENSVITVDIISYKDDMVTTNHLQLKE